MNAILPGAGPQDANQLHAQQQGPRWNLLVVEDHSDSLKILVRLLESLGHSVTAARTGHDALALLANANIHLIIGDVGLPDMTGYELMRQVRATRGIPGIAMSGYGTDQDLRLSRDAGFDEHLIKPVEVDQLEDAIRRALARPRPNSK